jgi:hypothetical protein
VSKYVIVFTNRWTQPFFPDAITSFPLKAWYKWITPRLFIIIVFIILVLTMMVRMTESEACHKWLVVTADRIVDPREIDIDMHNIDFRTGP